MEVKKTETDIQMRFADFDVLGHVNNVNQQHYFDLGKSDYFRNVMKIDMNWRALGIITAATSTSYLAQTRPEEPVYVETSAEKVGNKSIILFQRIISRATGEVKAESRSVMVAFDFSTQESVAVPDAWREAIGQTPEQR